MKIRLNNPKAQKYALDMVAQAPLDKGLVLSIEPDKEKRSGKQQALAEIWYRYRAAETGNTNHEEKAQCKLEYGVPILRTEDSDFRQAYDRLIKRMAYADKLLVMLAKEAGGFELPVTSRMDVKQMTHYLNLVDMETADKIGFVLPHPNDIYYEAMGLAH